MSDELSSKLPLLPGKDGQQVSRVSLSLNDVTECLDEPTALGCVPPAVEAWHGAVGNQKVSMAGDPVGGHTVRLSPLTIVHHLDSMVQLVSLASLQSITSQSPQSFSPLVPLPT